MATKITRALTKRLAQAKGAPVKAVVFAHLESENLTLSSFAARAAQRDARIRERLGQIVAAVQQWEQRSGQRADLELRPGDAAVQVTGPAALIEALADAEAVAAVDVPAA